MFVAVFIFVVEIAATVAGQILVKHAMERSNTIEFGHRRVLPLFIAGVAGLTISFFLTIGLLQHFDLSYFYPIQGSTVVLTTIAAAFFLRERLSMQLIIGSVLISIGIALVAVS